MKKSYMAILTIALLSTLVGCGKRVDVPTASIGRVMTSSGLEKQIHTTSSFRLPLNFWWNNPSELVVVDASDQQIREGLQVFMPNDLSVDGMNGIWKKYFRYHQFRCDCPSKHGLHICELYT